MTNQGGRTVEVRLDMECAIAVEQMAITENCTVSDILRAAISDRWDAHVAAERRRREKALVDTPRYRDRNLISLMHHRKRTETTLFGPTPERCQETSRGGR